MLWLRCCFLTELIDEGLHEWEMHKALSMYKDYRITLWRAAEIARVSLSELLAELPKQKIVFQYSGGVKRGSGIFLRSVWVAMRMPIFAKG